MTETAFAYDLGLFQWKRYRRPLMHEIPTHWRSWIFDTGSLTARLIRKSQGNFRVDLLGQHWDKPSPSERRALAMRDHHLALTREVYLYGRDVPWVFAHSVIPATTLTGKERQLAHLGTRPLGAYLFKCQSMRRTGLEVGKLVISPSQTLWARRSVFWLSEKPLLVCEYFLPELVSPNIL